MKNYTRTSSIRLSVAAPAIVCAVLFGGALFAGVNAQRNYPQQQRRGNVQQVTVDRGTISRAESYTGDRFNYFTETPRGARVVAVNRPRPEALRAIDEGLGDLFAAASRNNYRARLNYADYVVFIARADRTRDSTGAYSPDMAFDAGSYAGSVYDRGGSIYAAGMVSSYNPGALVVAEHERDFGRMANVVRYEGEHLILYHNDRRRFQETADHARGGAHPILR
ncbi:MAG: hypothetical protein QOD32_3285 [Pyrinomonadaceae bacterium]|jgi:hypothetical protein|nr:hypothetical protein [Pyrinomonadaceae bacterium]